MYRVFNVSIKNRSVMRTKPILIFHTKKDILRTRCHLSTFIRRCVHGQHEYQNKNTFSRFSTYWEQTVQLWNQMYQIFSLCEPCSITHIYLYLTKKTKADLIGTIWWSISSIYCMKAILLWCICGIRQTL